MGGFIVVTHGDCVAACLALVLASTGSTLAPEKIDYCGHVILERLARAKSQSVGLLDEGADWQLQYDNIVMTPHTRIQQSDAGPSALQGPLDPRPLEEEAADLDKRRADAGTLDRKITTM